MLKCATPHMHAILLFLNCISNLVVCINNKTQLLTKEMIKPAGEKRSGLQQKIKYLANRK